MEKAKDFARLFMVPGYGHCIGGPGPNHFDAVGVIDKWVVGKQPPQKFVATKYQDDDPQKTVPRTRPICLYPKVARWNGTGSIDNAANFDCE